MTRSVFPNGVDVFNELFDLPFEKVVDANRLTELKGKSVLTNDEQTEMLALTNSLKDYLITPETFNKFQDTLVAVEQFFYDNVQGFIEDKQVIWGTYINSFRYIGTWTSGVSYKFQNMVTDSLGNLYICKEDHIASVTPSSDAVKWQQASAKGAKGDTGLNALYKGEWVSTTAYAIGDVVRFGRTVSNDGVDYISIKAGTGQSPATATTYWAIYNKLFVGTERPTGVGEGLHFIKVVG